ncbi:type II secretion system F family protein [Arcobacter sp. CECT 8985]|uniref:type II secretion system F family protein n=1 Tax=Arcobacter sp. CECT 8985 TaxID=1935424 RepID=UPI00100B643B|nr:type II secretion system F family protein [Arcobacter sp. CECT 8985]RXJ86036.1 secretion system protein F [Arcobacter sp. CECT 8985]
MLFKYKGVDSKGNSTKGKIEAKDLLEAKRRLKLKSIYYTNLESTNFNFSKFFNKQKSIDTLTLSNLSRDLSIYLESGISLIKAVELLKKRYEKNRIYFIFFDTVYNYLDEGKNFYNALNSQKIINIPNFYKQSIKISEANGLLSSVLLELSIFLKEQNRIKKQVSQAMAYPTFILTISIFMVGFMLSFIVPKITQIFTQIDQELPLITKITIQMGDFFSNNYQMIFFCLIFMIFLFSYCLRKIYNFRYFIHSIVLKLPFFSKLIEVSELSRFSYMNSMLIKSGVPVVQSINLSANVLKNEVIKKLFIEASDSVVEGQKLSSFLKNSKIYKIEDSFIQSISIGEQTSKLSQILNNLAKLYNETNSDKIAIFLSLIEPVFMLIVGSIIGFIVVAMLLPIFSMNLG